MSVQQRSSNTTTYLTADEFWDLPEVEGKRLELVEGCVAEMPVAGARHNEIAFYIAFLLYQFVRQHGLGWASGDGVGYIISGERDSVFVPDASFVARERIPPEGTPVGFWPFQPDLAVEVVSPHDRATRVHDKVWRYLEAGTRAVWVVWPERRQISVFASGNPVAELGMNDQLDGSDVLPDFTVSVSEIFQQSGPDIRSTESNEE